MYSNNGIEIAHKEGLTYLQDIPNGSIDLALTDPPYIISKDTGMNKHFNAVKEQEEKNIEFVKQKMNGKHKKENKIKSDKIRIIIMKYGLFTVRNTV